MSGFKRGKPGEFANQTDEELRARIVSIRQAQRAIRNEHGGTRFRDLALAEVDAIAARVDDLASQALRRVALEGNPAPLGGPTQALSPDVREAALLDWIARGGFLDRLRSEIKAADGFSTATSTEMRKLLAPLDQEAQEIEAELGRRHDEKVALRRRLRELEEVEA